MWNFLVDVRSHGILSKSVTGIFAQVMEIRCYILLTKYIMRKIVHDLHTRTVINQMQHFGHGIVESCHGIFFIKVCMNPEYCSTGHLSLVPNQLSYFVMTDEIVCSDSLFLRFVNVYHMLSNFC